MTARTASAPLRQRQSVVTEATIRSVITYVWAGVAMGLSVAAWSLATPLMAAPDEPSHVIEAVAVLRGEFDEPQHHTVIGPIANVQVPRWAAETSAEPTCYAFQATVPASCAPKLSSDTRVVTASTQFSNYPPLYYLVVGLPSLAMTGRHALFAIRFVGVLLNAAFIALGLWMLARFHSRRFTLVGALIGMTPMVLFVMSVVNSSGLETSAAFATWCGGLCIVERDRLPRALKVWTAISVTCLILTRPASPVYAAIIALVLAVIAGRRRATSWLRDRCNRVLWIPAVAGVLVAAAFLVIDGIPAALGYPLKHRISLARSVWITVSSSGGRLRQCIGTFGWLDTPVTLFVATLWTTVFSALSLLALSLSAKCRRGLVLLSVAVIATPVLFESPIINDAGPGWQGRYWLPLVIGLPLVASSLQGWKPDHRRTSFLTTLPARLVGLLVLGGLLLVAQVASMLTALHRYQTGLGAAPGTPRQWSPPMGEPFVLGVLITGQVLLLAWIAWKAFDRKRLEPYPLPPAMP